MLKKRNTFISAAVLFAVFGASSLHSLYASSTMNCHAEYEKAKNTINNRSASADHREAAFRIAQHAYDLCTIGEEGTAKKFFEKLTELAS